MIRRKRPSNGKPGTYKSGDHYVTCDRSGFKVLKSTTQKEWNGLIVRKVDYEERNVQDFVRGRKDKQHVDEPRSEPADIFLTTNEVSADDL